MLPEVKSRLLQMQAQHRLYQEAQAQISANATSKAWQQTEQSFQALQTMLQQMADDGILVQDLDRGLIDFPHWRNGEEVLLCYELAEDAIGYWHDLERGFGGRQPL